MRKRTLFFVSLSLIAILAISVTVSMAQNGPPGSGWFTTISIQNPGSSGVANFNMTAKDVVPGTNSYLASGCIINAGSSKIHNPAFPPNGSTRIGFSGSCGSDGNDSLPTGFQGGVTISSDSPLVAVVSVGNNPINNGAVGTTGGRASAFYRGTDSTDTATSLSFPIAKNNFINQSTTFYIQAVEDASVTMTYSNGSTDGPHAIPAGQSRVFIPGDVIGSSFFGAATATSSTGAIAGTIIEHPHSTDPATFALSTRAFNPSEADDTVYAPIIKNNFFGNTALVVQAVNGGVTVEVDFAVTNSADGATCTDSTSAQVQISDGASANFGGPNDVNMPSGFGDGCFGAATVRKVSGSGQIVAAVNENNNGKKAVYSAFGASSATNTIAVPITKEEFANGRTAIVVQAVGNSNQSTTITASYVNNANCTTSTACVVTPNGGGAGSTPTSGGTAVNFRRLNQFSDQYTGTLPSGSGNGGAGGTNNAVIISSSNLPIVAIAQETGPVDSKNYEGFNQ